MPYTQRAAQAARLKLAFGVGGTLTGLSLGASF
jgi:hypothetical protein